MNILRARLYEIKLDEQRRDMEKFYGEKGEIAWGRQPVVRTAAVHHGQRSSNRMRNIERECRARR